MPRRGKGEGAIYKRADGRWEGQIDLGYVGGRRVRKSVYGRTRREVQEKLRKLLTDLDRGLPVLDERTTVAEYLRAWLKAVETRLRPRTFERYTEIVENVLVPFLGSVRIVQLQPQHVQQLIAVDLTRGRSARTAEFHRAVLRAALNDAVKWGLLTRNVAALTSPPHVERLPPAVWTAEEASRFLAAIRGHRLEALFTVALALGLRQGEALGLSWDDVDLARSVLTVRAQLQWHDGQWLRLPPKSSAGVRTLPLPEICVASLRQHRVQQAEERLAAGLAWRGNPWNLVFTTSVGTPISARNVVRLFQGLCARAEVRPIRFHDLRHTCATLLLAQGVSPRVVQEVLGHSQVSLTLGTYSHVLPQLLTDAAKRIDEALGQG